MTRSSAPVAVSLALSLTLLACLQPPDGCPAIEEAVDEVPPVVVAPPSDAGATTPPGVAWQGGVALWLLGSTQPLEVGRRGEVWYELDLDLASVPEGGELTLEVTTTGGAVLTGAKRWRLEPGSDRRRTREAVVLTPSAPDGTLSLEVRPVGVSCADRWWLCQRRLIAWRTGRRIEASAIAAVAPMPVRREHLERPDGRSFIVRIVNGAMLPRLATLRATPAAPGFTATSDSPAGWAMLPLEREAIGGTLRWSDAGPPPLGPQTVQLNLDLEGAAETVELPIEVVP